ncbi:lipoprotein [Leptospira semungkisensis]|uniref:Lipoprotein n=1 Tax=Leptospira semungkisensis TaxID=2484985 RepID=A0A4V3JB43_9LEPT|nr:lipoprotein [Leptospira semungkisensis]TGK00829.1 lipoprotein [Leptospira semungkisensis]
MKLKLFVVMCVLLIVGCDYFNTGTVRVATKRESVKSVYLLGYIENRDTHFDPFNTKNLTSMLKFELLDAGYGILLIDDYVKSGDDSNSKKESTSANDASKALLAGDANALKGGDFGSRILKESEIKSFQGVANFDYLIQGAIAMGDNRKLLDKTESGIVFLEIFDKSGKIVTSINYTIEGKVLTEPEMLKAICSKIIDKIDKREEKKPWWKIL